ncbi:MAG: S8 family serine peptidase [Bacteroidetes bacterium]|nr:S8 family serine peptidase [Bacteroidota bacterium]
MTKLVSILLLIFCCSIITAQAQTSDVPVRFAKGNFITGNNITQKSFTAAALQPAKFGDRFFALVQFTQLPDANQKNQLKQAGLELGGYLPGNAYFAAINSSFDFSSAASFHINAVNAVPVQYKTDDAVYDIIAIKNMQKVIAVTFYNGIDKTSVSQSLQQLGAVIVTTTINPEHTIFIQPVAAAVINQIAALPFVQYINAQRLDATPINYNDIATHGFSSVQSLLGRNLRGKNVTVGIGDNAEISSHVDFTGRLINRVFSVPSGHGIHTSGTTAGAGILNPMYQGMAPKATIVSQWFNDIITNTPVYVADNNMIATNNSYTNADNACPGEGVYDVNSNYADAQMKTYDEVLHVFAAGNDGVYTCSPYPGSYATIKTGWQCAKNVLTVGNMNQANYAINGSSSRGPVNDGRLKPEIVTNGTSTTSTQVNNGYGTSSGTSMATPVVTGATVLLNERYHQLHGGNPKAALLKALMCNTAEDLGTAGPDYTFGYGMLNVRKAVEAMENNQYYISSTPGSYNITIPAGVRRLKVMLYWADAAASVPAGTTLVNDLDLTVTDNPVTVTHLPLVLNPAPGSVTLAATEGADHTNNIEQVVIDNPAAGNYIMNVAAFSVPQGPQEYILTYQMDMNGITVEYPFGGETLVPGASENIRWTAYVDESNTFTVAYSSDNGGTWTNINTAVAATARNLVWTVPATVSNNYLIRVSRNGGAGYTDQSDYNFVVLGQPTVTATVPCEGYVNLSWPAITSATSYDIMQLVGDSMQVIANTTGTSYLVQGLNASTLYWFGVRANNGSSFGRRSVSVSATPSSGTCSLSAFDNNFKASALTAPVTGRQFTSTALGAAEQIKFVITNLDDVASTGNYDVSYQVNGGTIFTETLSAGIASLSTSTHTFTQTYDFSATGTYVIKAWVKHTGDTQPFDDTVSVTIKNLDNAPLTLPFTDGFETTTVKEYTINTVGLDGDDHLDFSTNSSRGRARTFVNTGFALNGSRAITLDQFPNGVLNTDSLLMTFNTSSYTLANQLRLDFNYKNHGVDNNPDNRVWIRGSDADSWLLAYNLVSNQAALGQWKTGIININDILGAAIPAQTVTSSFQVKFGQEGNTSANDPNPLVDQDDGYTFDDIKLSEAFNDVALQNVVSPTGNGCNAIGTQPVSLTIKNYSGTSFTNVPVAYRINGGSWVTENVPAIAPNATQVYTFATAANLLVNADYTFDFYIAAPADSYANNDSIISYSFHTSPVITVTSTQDYLEGFESTDGGWYTKGTNSSWQWGTPTKTIINKAANGNNVWVTNLTGNYNDNEFSYLYSPCFDLSGLTQPVLSFSHIFSVETGYDYTWVEYSTDGGLTWNRLGVSGTGTNWYDMASPPQWRLSQTKWHVASFDVPTTASNVRFRIVMSSDGGLDMEGVAVDDIHIFEKTNIYTGTDITTGIPQTIAGGNQWYHFDYNGKRVASINPLTITNPLGLTNAYVYFNPAVPIRYSTNNQYYLDRNIVLKVTTQPAGNVLVRFYFTDAEAKALMNATGCGVCTTISDPYVSGVTQYSDAPTPANEDGTLANNVTGFYQFKLPADVDIIPYDTGYYAEFVVNSFSEFWINNGGTNNATPLPVSVLTFTVTKQANSVLLQWNTANETNMANYIVERSSDGIHFNAIGTVPSRNTGGAYAFTDSQPLDGLNYYRIKAVDQNNAFKYTQVEKVLFSGSKNGIVIYPNPASSVINISSAGNATNAQLYDAAGKLVRTKILKGKLNVLPLHGIAKGIYQLRIVTEQSAETEKIIVQ